MRTITVKDVFPPGRQSGTHNRRAEVQRQNGKASHEFLSDTTDIDKTWVPVRCECVFCMHAGSSLPAWDSGSSLLAIVPGRNRRAKKAKGESERLDKSTCKSASTILQHRTRLEPCLNRQTVLWFLLCLTPEMFHCFRQICTFETLWTPSACMLDPANVGQTRSDQKVRWGDEFGISELSPWIRTCDKKSGIDFLLWWYELCTRTVL